MSFGTRGMKLTNVTSAFQRALCCAWGSSRLSHCLTFWCSCWWLEWSRCGRGMAVWSAGKGWWCLLGAAVQDGAGSARVCFDSSSVKDSLCLPARVCLVPGSSQDCTPGHCSGLAGWKLCEQIVRTSLVASSTCRERKCQPREQHELFGCYQTSSSMLIWVRSACVSQWNKMIIVTNRVFHFSLWMLSR